MTHKDWLDNEYNQWIRALQAFDVNDFKESVMVRRMLSEIPYGTFSHTEEPLLKDQFNTIVQIDNIGKVKTIDGACQRMIYWAQQVLKHNPKSITEIGAGVGEFYAIIRALGYKGEYYIYDLPEVKEFQRKYLDEVTRQTGLNTNLSEEPLTDFFCSFYAFGEFTDELKEEYMDLIGRCKHGFIVWNPHSGATTEFPIIDHNITIQDTIEENIKLVTW